MQPADVLALVKWPPPEPVPAALLQMAKAIYDGNERNTDLAYN